MISLYFIIPLIANTKSLTYPCGACRQVILELMNKDAVVTICNIDKKVETVKVKDLLPKSFSEDNLYE